MSWCHLEDLPDRPEQYQCVRCGYVTKPTKLAKERLHLRCRVGGSTPTTNSDRSFKSRGLGDTVAKAIEVATFGLVKKKSGCGCDKRQKWLNEKFPYRDDADERGSAAG